jgi:hypothetical protein
VFQAKKKLSKEISSKTSYNFFCKKRNDFIVTSNAKWVLGRRIKKNLKWEIGKEDLENKKYYSFPKVHKGIISSIHFVKNEKNLLAIGENGLIILFEVKSRRQVDSLDLNMKNVLCVSTIGNLGVLGASGGFEFIQLDPLSYINYRNPNSNKFSQFINKVRGKKENESTSGVKLHFKCDIISTICFALNYQKSFILVFGGINSKYISSFRFKGQFSFLESKIKKKKKGRAKSLFSNQNFLKPGKGNEASSKSLSKKMSFTSLFSFNQNEAELKKVVF